MITPKYIAAISSIIASINSLLFIPGIDTVLIVALIFLVIIISLIVNLFFFWEALRKILFKELLSKFYLDLYSNDEFVDFLIEKRNTRKNKTHKSVHEN
jgi:hypothetical protein